jgi:hypothetical protein
MVLKAILPILLWLAYSELSAQPDSIKFYKAVQARAHYGFIFAHSEAVENTAGSNPYGLEIELIKQKVDVSTFQLCNCYPVKGWSFSYFNFDNAVLGNGFTAAYFLEPAYRLSSKTQFRFRGSAGFSYLTNPYHPLHNPDNMSYSSILSGFLQLGAGVSYQVSRQWLIQIGGQYQHVSNGGLKEPNKGINWPTASAGVTYFNRPYNLPSYRRSLDRTLAQRKPYVEAGLFFSAKQGSQPGGRTPRTPLLGLLAQVEKPVSGTNALNTGLEVYYDNALKQSLHRDSIDGSPLRVGFLAGHNFLLGKFLFSQQLGVYLFKRAPYYDRIYHRWTMRYQINKHWIAGIGLNAHRHIADFIDLRLMYKF